MLPGSKVPRELLSLVEPGIPDSIAGFPLKVRIVETLSVVDKLSASPNDERYKRWLVKAAKLAADGINKAYESVMEVLSVDPVTPSDSAFELGSEYILSPSVDAFQQEFVVPESDHGSRWHWDD